jgi:hypothetical protein
MSKCFTVYKEVEVDVELDDFTDDDLIEELEGRGFTIDGHSMPEDNNELLTKIYHLRRQGQAFDQELGQLIYQVLGRVV